MRRAVRIRRPILAILLLAALGACGDGGGDAEDGAGDQAAVVELMDFEIEAPATVAAGSGITVRNTGEVAHTWTAEDETWDTGTIDPGGESTVTIDEPGTYEYRCTIHPDTMTGSIEVTG